MLPIKYFFLLFFVFFISFSILESKQKYNERSIASSYDSCFDLAYDFDIYEAQIDYSDNYVSALFNDQEIGFVQFEISGDELKIIQIDVDENFRRKGIQNKLYDEILSRNSDLKKMSGDLAMLNEEVFYASLMKRFGHNVDEDYNVGSQFEECCKEKFLGLSIGEKEEYFMDALEETPWFKSRVNQGFYEFCSKHSLENFIETEIISVSMCR